MQTDDARVAPPRAVRSGLPAGPEGHDRALPHEDSSGNLEPEGLRGCRRAPGFRFLGSPQPPRHSQTTARNRSEQTALSGLVQAEPGSPEPQSPGTPNRTICVPSAPPSAQSRPAPIRRSGRCARPFSFTLRDQFRVLSQVRSPRLICAHQPVGQMTGDLAPGHTCVHPRAGAATQRSLMWVLADSSARRQGRANAPGGVR